MNATATPSTTALSGSEIQAALRDYGLTDAKIRYELQATGLTPAGLLERVVDAQMSLAAYQANRRGYPAPSASQRTAPPAALPPAAAPSVPAPAPAATPPRPAWTLSEMDERVRRIVQSHWAEGRKALAVMLCSSHHSIAEAIGVLKASAADTTSNQQHDTGAEILARRRRDVAHARGESVVVADHPPSSGQLDASEIFARRRAAAAANRGQTSAQVSVVVHADTPAGKPTLNASAIFAARRAACRQA